MTKIFLSLFTLLLSVNCVGSNTVCKKEQIKIAIIDTGLNIKDSRFYKHVCPTGHYNFIDNSENVTDVHGHGTHVAGLIQKYAGEGNYCFLIYKYYSDNNSGSDNMGNEIKSIHKALQNGANIINISGGGPEFSTQEYQLIKNSNNVTFIVAAGNDGKNIDLVENYYYPASYELKNVIVVGNIDYEGNIAKSSNYGKIVHAFEVGIRVHSFLPNDEEGNMTGTSMSTAIHTGKIVSKNLNNCDIGF